ncbi:MAG: 3' terminal RNA ribose 2'-O-methyltransferase Hen1 [Blastocatellia bacterium]|nr:3' terminal RNA ribose 2'-O-methyltransferase Hen1 [Blastocatellia bacterium]
MLLTITTTHRPATDLGYLLHKNPARTHTLKLSFGQAYVFYPEAGEERCTAALLLDIDPVGLVRGRRGPAGEGAVLEQYVNDRPYVASSFLSVAISQMFGTAMSGRSRERQELADAKLPFLVRIAALPCRGGQDILRRLFEPLGYEVKAQGHVLDENFPDWGDSIYFTVELNCVTRLRQLLSHLYVLVPVLDADKHYWIGDDEVEKLFRHGEEWLPAHPERELVVKRYLKHRRYLTQMAFDRLLEEDNRNADEKAESHAREEGALEEKISLNQQRIDTVVSVLKEDEARRVVDLGCGEGRLLSALLKDRFFLELLGVDVSYRALEIAEERLKLDRLPDFQKSRIKLTQGALTYRDRRLAGFDAATVIEVIEHLDQPRLAAFERSLFEFARPQTIVVTTPNAEYNVKFENLPAGRLRHRDHRFEWTRAEFQNWSTGVAQRFGYSVRFLPIGPLDETLGAPTQMGVFTRQ